MYRYIFLKTQEFLFFLTFQYQKRNIILKVQRMLQWGWGAGDNPLNFSGYKKSAIGGLIWGGFKGAKLTKISCVRFLIFFE